MKQNNAFLLIFLLLAFLFGFISTSWSQEKAEEWFLKGNTLSSQNRFEDAVEAYKKYRTERDSKPTQINLTNK